MDHGVSLGPIPGIVDIKSMANAIAEGGADAAIVHKGAAIFGHRGYGRDLGLMVHLSASTSLAGPKMGNDREVLEMVAGAIEAGAAGTSIGRNIFRHPSPTKIVRAIAAIVHHGESVEEAMKLPG